MLGSEQPRTSRCPDAVYLNVVKLLAWPGVTDTGTVQCWGDNNLSSDAPAGQFVAVAAGYWHSCGLLW